MTSSCKCPIGAMLLSGILWNNPQITWFFVLLTHKWNIQRFSWVTILSHALRWGLHEGKRTKRYFKRWSHLWHTMKNATAFPLYLSWHGIKHSILCILTCSLPGVININFLFARDISYSMENLAFDSLLTWLTDWTTNSHYITHTHLFLNG